MNIDSEYIKELVRAKINGTDQFIVDIEVKPGKVCIFMDKPTGVTISECSVIHRHLKAEIQDEEFFERYDLEVSSPGIDRPFKVQKQYERRIGSELEIILTDGTNLQGVLQFVDENGIELLKNSDNVSKAQTISFNKIKEAKLMINFDKKKK